MAWSDEELRDGIEAEFAAANAVVPDGQNFLTSGDRVGNTKLGGQLYRNFRIFDPWADDAANARKTPEERANWVRKEALSGQQKKVLLLRSGWRPQRWTDEWRRIAAQAGVKAPAASARSAARAATIEAALARGERPTRWSRLWVRAAKKLGIEVPKTAAARVVA